MKENPRYDLLIIGAGPAGLTAGIYAGRFKLNTLIMEKAGIGGQIVMSADIENYPGFPGGIATYDLMEKFKKQVDDLEVRIEYSEAGEISAIPAGFVLKSTAGTYETKALIVACGAQPKRLGVAGEEKFIGHGVSYCGVCDAPMFKDKFILVIGGGDRAVEEALYLARYACGVTIVHRRDSLRASRILEDKAKDDPKISFVLDSVVEEITGGDRVEGVTVKNLKTGLLKQLPCQGIFIFVGIQPNTGFIKKMLNIDESGFIITDQHLATSLPGIFACGDCLKKSLYQVVNACAEGALAAYSAHKYLMEI